MIPLIESSWEKLSHAYGSADDIPELIRQMAAFPKEEDYKSEPFFSLWSALCHQDDSYSASYAAVPHIVDLIESDSEKASLTYFTLPVAIEISRARGLGESIPEDTEGDYKESLVRLGKLAQKELLRSPSALRKRYLEAAVAISTGDIEAADSILNDEE